MSTDSELETDEKTNNANIARKHLQRLYFYALILFPISVILFVTMYEPMVALAIFINGNGGAFWGAFYYTYLIAGYYAFVLVFLMCQYLKFYAFVKHNTYQTTGKSRRGMRYVYTTAANPTILGFLIGLLTLTALFVLWGVGATYTAVLIPMNGIENIGAWILFNVSNILIFVGWVLIVMLCYLEELKHNRLEIE